jgi:predicted SprT family Zn-dependent metalloprotease
MATREEWLEAAVRALLDDVFNGAIPKDLVRVSCGWPHRGGVSERKKTLGQCWPRASSTDGTNQIFINPILFDGEKVLEVLVHELCHAIDDCQHGHGKPFIAIAKAAGLQGPWTSTSCGPELKEKLRLILLELGPYPHAALKVESKVVQKTFMLKAECPDCGAVIRITQKWVDAASARGGLRCPVCQSTEPMVVERG